MLSFKRILPGIIIFGIFILALQCSKKESVETSQNVVPVHLADVKTETVAIPIHGSGLLYSEKQIRLSFKTGGIVEDIAVQEGDNVKKGQMLARLDLDEIQAQVQQAQSAFDKAQRDYDRIQKLYADSVVTLEQKQNVETQRQVARSTLQIATFNLDYSTITAPADGRILKQFVEENELVGPGTPIFYFGSGREEWLLRVGVADRQIVQLQQDDTAIVEFDVYPDVEFRGRITGVAQAADPQNGTFEVEIQLDSQGRRLAAGFVARVTFLPQQNEAQTLIPLAALVDARGSDGAVFTVVDNTAKKIPVTTGAIIKDRIIITSGLENVTKVVTAGAAYLRAGDTVHIQ